MKQQVMNANIKTEIMKLTMFKSDYVKSGYLKLTKIKTLFKKNPLSNQLIINPKNKGKSKL